jgi:transcriptional regulator of acetoin/glycerol metabolism
MREAMLEFQQALVRVALARNSVRGHANLSAAASELGIPRATLYRVLKRL